MFIRNMRKSDYAAVDALLLQIHQVNVDGRPEMFAPIEQYMTKDSYDSLVANKNVISILAQERGKIIGCCFVSMLERSGMAHMKSAYAHESRKNQMVYRNDPEYPQEREILRRCHHSENCHHRLHRKAPQKECGRSSHVLCAG